MPGDSLNTNSQLLVEKDVPESFRALMAPFSFHSWDKFLHNIRFDNYEQRQGIFALQRLAKIGFPPERMTTYSVRSKS